MSSFCFLTKGLSNHFFFFETGQTEQKSTGIHPCTNWSIIYKRYPVKKSPVKNSPVKKSPAIKSPKWATGDRKSPVEINEDTERMRIIIDQGVFSWYRLTCCTFWRLYVRRLFDRGLFDLDSLQTCCLYLHLKQCFFFQFFFLKRCWKML